MKHHETNNRKKVKSKGESNKQKPDSLKGVLGDGEELGGYWCQGCNRKGQNKGRD